MSDPAVEAMCRAWRSDGNVTANELGVNAAREALAPLRKLHYKAFGSRDERRVCAECGRDWPCVTARFIYREDEL